MKRAALLLFVATFLVMSRVVLEVGGAAEHTSVIAGMPISPASWTVGPLYVLAYLASVVVAPVLAIAAALDGWTARTR